MSETIPARPPLSILIGLAALALAGCESTPPPPTCEGCRPITLPSGRCAVAIPGHHYVAAAMRRLGVEGSGEPAIRQAIDDIDRAGGIHGLPLGLVLCETVGDPGLAVQVVEELASVPEIAAVSCCSRSLETIAVAEVARDRGIVVLSPSSTSIAISELADDGYVARTCASDAQQGEVAARIARESTDRLLVVASPDPAQAALADQLERTFAELGGTTMRATYERAGEDFVPPLSQLVDAIVAFAPGTVFVAGLSDDAADLIETAADRDIGVGWLLPPAARDPAFLAATSDHQAYVEANVRGIAPAPPPAWFATRFTETWGAAPGTFHPHAYDATMLLAIAIAAADDPGDRAQVRDALLARTRAGAPASAESGWAAIAAELERAGEVDYQGASGPVDFDSRGDVASGIALWRIRANDFEDFECRTATGTPCP
jgi:branched-chain amino acid transport system substrate-binding protein